MKYVTGKVKSTKPISISKAAKFLSEFVLTENGTSGAVPVYLSRASAAFNDLVSFHKELKGAHYDGKPNEHRSVIVVKEDNSKTEVFPEQAKGDALKNVEDFRKHKKRVKPVKIEEVEDNKLRYVEDSGKDRKRWSEDRKAEQSVKVEKNLDDGGNDRKNDLEDSSRKLGKKKKKIEGVRTESEVSLGINEEIKKKTRKSGEVDDGEVNLNEQSGSKKKKKRKIEGHL